MQDYPKECECPSENISIEFSVNLEENEDLEEIDENENEEDSVVPHNLIWKEISDKFDNDRKEINDYKKAKLTECQVPLNPAVQFLENEVFPYLINIIESTMNTAKDLECVKHQKTAFNGIDYIAEMLWNLNCKHPERKDNWTYIFDIDWVTEWLKNHPRPFYPFSWIWSKDYAATKIQAAIRGHWVRCRENVQEMRQFWKTLAREKQRSTDPSVQYK